MSSICSKKKKTLAELRTINLCDSDLSLQAYNANLRKFSMSSHSCYSGTESQQSISARSFYDNVDEIKDTFIATSRFLMPPKPLHKSSVVNRSKSFQETTKDRAELLALNSNSWLRRNRQESSSIENSFVDFNVMPLRTPEVENRLSAPPSFSCDKKANGPFYVKILRRLRKISLHWRKCKRAPRGTKA